MTVEYFTPSKEDIEQAPHRLLVIQAQLENSPILYSTDEMTVLDFSHLYTEEEKAIARAILQENILPSCFGDVEFTSYQPCTVRCTKARARHVLGNSPLQPLSEATVVEVKTSYGSMSGDPKDFTPVVVQSVLPSAQVKSGKIKVSYKNTGIKTIEGLRSEDYFKKDKL